MYLSHKAIPTCRDGRAIPFIWTSYYTLYIRKPKLVLYKLPQLRTLSTLMWACDGFVFCHLVNTVCTTGLECNICKLYCFQYGLYFVRLCFANSDQINFLCIKRNHCWGEQWWLTSKSVYNNLLLNCVLMFNNHCVYNRWLLFD